MNGFTIITIMYSLPYTSDIFTFRQVKFAKFVCQK